MYRRPSFVQMGFIISPKFPVCIYPLQKIEKLRGLDKVVEVSRYTIILSNEDYSCTQFTSHFILVHLVCNKGGGFIWIKHIKAHTLNQLKFSKYSSTLTTYTYRQKHYLSRIKSGFYAIFCILYLKILLFEGQLGLICEIDKC